MRKIRIGDQALIKRKITDEMIRGFAQISEDFNPIHIDEEEAKNSIFKGRVAHGLLVSSLISGVIGTKLPGNGTIYIEEESKFILPVMLNDIITVKVSFVEILNKDKGIIRLSHEVTNQNNKMVLKGNSIVKVDREILV